MELLTRNPGLRHVAEEIFLNLNTKYLLDHCPHVNESWASIIDRANFLVRKCIRQGIFKEYANAWIKAVRLMTKDQHIGIVTAHLKHLLHNTYIVYKNSEWDFPPIHWASERGYSKLVEVWATSTENPNASAKYELEHTPIQCTPMYLAARRGHVDVIRILAPLTNNPNAYSNGRLRNTTPIYEAAICGYANIVELLAPLTDYPNAPTQYGLTPNAPRNQYGLTPIFVAAQRGHVDVIRILAPLTMFPNAPEMNNDWVTPIDVACRSYLGNPDIRERRRIEIVRILSS